MTVDVHRHFLAVPYSAANYELMQRIGVAVYEEYTPITNATRLSIINGTMPIAQVLAYDIPPYSQESRNYVTVCQFNDSGTADFLLGAGAMPDVKWQRVNSRLGLLPAGYKYARFETTNGSAWPLVGTNVALLSPYLGQELTLLQAMGICKLKRL